MKVRQYEDTDYKTICHWWIDWGMDIFPKQFLPKNGYIVSSGGIDYAAVWVYRTDSKIRLLECFVSNPNANISMKSLAIDKLIQVVSTIATKQGYILWSSTDNIKLGERLEQQNFDLIDEEMKHYIRYE
jgi:hypothetical protein